MNNISENSSMGSEDNPEHFATSADDTLASFLRDLAVLVEEKRLQGNYLSKLKDFYLSYQFEEQVGEQINNDSEFSYEELKKFIFLGYYIYTCLLADRKPPS